MSAQATFWAWGIQVPSSEKLVLLCLSDCHNGDTGQCNPSVNYISRKTSLDRKTVLKALRVLSDQEVLSRIKVEGSSNQYFLAVEAVPNMGRGVAQISPKAVPNMGHKPISKPKKNLHYENGDLETAKTIYNLILTLNPKHRQPSIESWANEIRLMREKDNCSPAELYQDNHRCALPLSFSPTNQVQSLSMVSNLLLANTSIVKFLLASFPLTLQDICDL